MVASAQVVPLGHVGTLPLSVRSAPFRASRRAPLFGHLAGARPARRDTLLEGPIVVGRREPLPLVHEVDSERALTVGVFGNLRTATDPAAFSPTPPPLTLLGPSILVVDDDPEIRELVSDFLCMEGYRVCTATNGAEALKLVERTAPRLVLLDMRMPVLDGWGFARVLQEQREQLPLVVMSAAVNAERWASEIDAAGYVGKPFDVEHLLDTVERLLVPSAPPPAPIGPRPLAEDSISAVRGLPTTGNDGAPINTSSRNAVA